MVTWSLSLVRKNIEGAAPADALEIYSFQLYTHLRMINSLKLHILANCRDWAKWNTPDSTSQDSFEPCVQLVQLWSVWLHGKLWKLNTSPISLFPQTFHIQSWEEGLMKIFNSDFPLSQDIEKQWSHEFPNITNFSPYPHQINIFTAWCYDIY